MKTPFSHQSNYLNMNEHEILFEILYELAKERAEKNEAAKSEKEPDPPKEKKPEPKKPEPKKKK